MLTYRQEMKVLSIIVKYLPPFIAIMYFFNSVLSIFGIYISCISHCCYCGLIPLFLIYICCSVLKYCTQYKAYLWYIAINDTINWIDYEYGFTEDIRIGLIIVLLNLFFLICLLMIEHIHSGKAIL